MKTVSIDLPDSLDTEEFEIKMLLAGQLYERGKVSLGKRPKLLELASELSLKSWVDSDFPCSAIRLKTCIKTLPMHNAVVISDSSCVILFTKIDKLDILRNTYEHIYVTQEIAHEIGNALPSWVEVREVRNKKLQSLFEEGLDIGEASALALAFEIPDCTVILDDMKARKSAEKMNIRVTGSIGVILSAKKEGKIPSVKDVFEKIRATNFRISDRIINEAIKAAGE